MHFLQFSFSLRWELRIPTSVGIANSHLKENENDAKRNEYTYPGGQTRLFWQIDMRVVKHVKGRPMEFMTTNV